MRAVILDTGVANLSSLAFAVKRLGVEPIITREAAEIRAADRIFLPGVGTARAAMAASAALRTSSARRRSPCSASASANRFSDAAARRRTAWTCSASSMPTSEPSGPTACRCRTWAGTGSIPRTRLMRDSSSGASRPATGSTSCTATQCPRAPARPPAARTARSSRQLRHTKTSWACSSIRNAPAAPAHA